MDAANAELVVGEAVGAHDIRHALVPDHDGPDLAGDVGDWICKINRINTQSII